MKIGQYLCQISYTTKIRNIFFLSHSVSLLPVRLLIRSRPIERVGLGVSYLGPHDVWGPRRRSEIKKYTRMHRFEKKFKISLERPRENVSPGSAVALDWPDTK